MVYTQSQSVNNVQAIISAFARYSRRIPTRWIATLSILFVSVMILWLTTTDQSALRIDMLDVGQGDAIVIQLDSGETILVDGGPDATVTHHLSRLLGWRKRTIDLMILTHPDTDHLTGLMEVARRFRVRTVLTTGLAIDAPQTHAWNEWLKNGPQQVVFARRNDRWNIGNTTLTILYPFQPLVGRRTPTIAPQARGGTNDTSMVFRLDYQNDRFLFMGDASGETEEQLLALGDDLRATVLKVGHHGSRFSTTAALINAVKPQWAVISVGPNPFGHPAQSVMTNLTRTNTRVLRTDQHGTVTIRIEKDGGLAVRAKQ